MKRHVSPGRHGRWGRGREIGGRTAGGRMPGGRGLIPGGLIPGEMGLMPGCIGRWMTGGGRNCGGLGVIIRGGGGLEMSRDGGAAPVPRLSIWAWAGEKAEKHTSVARTRPVTDDSVAARRANLDIPVCLFCRFRT